MRTIIIAALALVATPASIAQAPQAVTDYSGLVSQLRPMVVTLKTETRNAAPALDIPEHLRDAFPALSAREGRASRGEGSGFVVDASRGLIATTHYMVVGDTDVVAILHDGQSRTAEIVGHDEFSGIGLIRIDPAGLTSEIAWSDRAVRPGEPVLSLANAYSLGVVASGGIVSAAHIEIEDEPFDMLALDMRVHRGSAGGPVVDMNGTLVGMSVGQFGAGYDAQMNLGLAIPSAEVRRITGILARDGKVERGRIGVIVKGDVDGNVVISTVEPGSSANRAGLKEGDMIKAAAGQGVTSERMLRQIIASQDIGSSVPLTVQRAGETFETGVLVERVP